MAMMHGAVCTGRTMTLVPALTKADGTGEVTSSARLGVSFCVLRHGVSDVHIPMHSHSMHSRWVDVRACQFPNE